METWPMITASCEHCADVTEGAVAVACVVGSYGLCAECKARLDARGLLVPVNESDQVAAQPVDWDDMKRKMDAFIATLENADEAPVIIYLADQAG